MHSWCQVNVRFMLQLFYPNTHLTGASVDPKGNLDMKENRKIPYLGWT